MINTVDTEPRSVVEIASQSNNEVLREMAMRITSLAEDAKASTIQAIFKLGFAFPGSTLMAVGSVYKYTTTPNTSDLLLERLLFSGLVALGAIGAVIFLPAGAIDVNDAALARGEINSLTTVLASEIIAESKQS